MAAGARTVGAAPEEAPQAAARARRQPLTRASILHAALGLIDQQGLEAFTMRKLAQELAVDAMALYRHFANKEALLDGLAELLWSEVERPGSDAHWEVLLRSIATSLRAMARAHPNAYALLCNRQVLPLAMLRLNDIALEQLQGAGFAQDRAREIMCTVCSYAMGYAMVELSALLPDPSCEAAAQQTDIGRVAEVMRRLPREAPVRLVEVACLLANCDTDAQFTFGLDLMLTGLKARQG